MAIAQKAATVFIRYRSSDIQSPITPSTSNRRIRMGTSIAHNAHKVGQYVTLGLEQKRSWEEKAKFFRHTLKHHCVVPPDADPDTQAFYKSFRVW